MSKTTRPVRRESRSHRSATFDWCRTLYLACEQRLDDETTLLGPVGAKSAFFLQWRQLFHAMCDLETRYQRARARGKGRA